MATLSIRLQTNPLWIIQTNGDSVNLPQTVDELTATSHPSPQFHGDDMDIKSWIKDNKDLHNITHVLDENWIEADMDDLYDPDNPMTVEDYLDFTIHWDDIF
jgi:hypothetical protein